MSRKWKQASRLAMGEFKRGHLEDIEHQELLESFGGLVTEVLNPINDGKEATVYLCVTDASVGVPYLAAKVYRARKFRAFSNDMGYVDTSRIRSGRVRRALEHRTSAGRNVAHQMWVAREWTTLHTLHDAGVAVPRPYDASPDAILMSFIGDDRGVAAPRLIDAELDTPLAREVYHGLMRDVERMLACNVVHGDLSAYNTLLHGGRAVIIDLPQTVDAKTSPQAQVLFFRDVANVCTFFHRFGSRADPERIARDLWRRFRCGELSAE